MSQSEKDEIAANKLAQMTNASAKKSQIDHKGKEKSSKKENGNSGISTADNTPKTEPAEPEEKFVPPFFIVKPECMS